MSLDFVRLSSQYLGPVAASVTAAPITVSCWFQVEDPTTATSHSLFSLGDTASNTRHFTLAYTTGAADDVLWWVVSGGGVFAQYSTTFAANTWYHVCGVEISATSRYVYLDGAASAENTTNRAPGSIDSMAIGRTERSTPYLYNGGLLAHVAVWNAALVAGEVSMLAAGLSPMLVHPQSLVNYWPIEGNLDPEIDIVGGYDMALNNSPTKAAQPPVTLPFSQEIITTPAAVIAAMYRRRLIFAG